MIHGVVYGALWHRLKEWQERWIDEAQHGVRPGGEHLDDAGDLQIDIEEADATRTPLVGALLDYGKFFDRFGPCLVRGLLTRAGLPDTLAN